MNSQYFMINNTKLTIRSGGDMGNIASQWPNPKAGPPLGKYKCDGEPHVKYQNGLMPSPRQGTVNEQLPFWKGQKRRLGSGSLTNSVTQRKLGGRINEQHI